MGGPGRSDASLPLFPLSGLDLRTYICIFFKAEASRALRAFPDILRLLILAPGFHGKFLQLGLCKLSLARLARAPRASECPNSFDNSAASAGMAPSFVEFSATSRSPLMRFMSAPAE